MEWGEFRVLYRQKLREAQDVTRRARAVEEARERRPTWRSLANRLICFLQAFFTRGTTR